MDLALTTKLTDNGLGLYRVSGLVTQDRAVDLLTDNHGWVRTLGLAAQVADYQGAELALPVSSLAASARQVAVPQRDTGGLLVPTALLVPADTMDFWRRYCWQMAQAGILRRAFTDYESARQWAEEQAALWAAQARFRSHGQ